MQSKFFGDRNFHRKVLTVAVPIMIRQTSHLLSSPLTDIGAIIVVSGHDKRAREFDYQETTGALALIKKHEYVHKTSANTDVDMMQIRM